MSLILKLHCKNVERGNAADKCSGKACVLFSLLRILFFFQKKPPKTHHPVWREKWVNVLRNATANALEFFFVMRKNLETRPGKSQTEETLLVYFHFVTWNAREMSAEQCLFHLLRIPFSQQIAGCGIFRVAEQRVLCPSHFRYRSQF